MQNLVVYQALLIPGSRLLTVLACTDGRIRWNIRRFLLVATLFCCFYLSFSLCHVGFSCLHCSSINPYAQFLPRELCVIHFGFPFDCKIVLVLNFVDNKGVWQHSKSIKNSLCLINFARMDAIILYDAHWLWPKFGYGRINKLSTVWPSRNAPPEWMISLSSVDWKTIFWSYARALAVDGDEIEPDLDSLEQQAITFEESHHLTLEKKYKTSHHQTVSEKQKAGEKTRGNRSLPRWTKKDSDRQAAAHIRASNCKRDDRMESQSACCPVHKMTT